MPLNLSFSLCPPNGGSTFRLNAVGITTSNTYNANDGYSATSIGDTNKVLIVKKHIRDY